MVLKNQANQQENQKGFMSCLLTIQPQIIKRWSSKETEYVFPFIGPEMTVRRKKPGQPVFYAPAC
jgi:hypothetical protein